MADVAVGTFVSTRRAPSPTRRSSTWIRRCGCSIRTRRSSRRWSSRMPSRATSREKFNWLEEQYVNDVFTIDRGTPRARPRSRCGIRTPPRSSRTTCSATCGRARRCSSPSIAAGTGVLTVTLGSGAERRRQRRRQAPLRRLGVPAGRVAARAEVLAARAGLQLHRRSSARRWSFSRTATDDRAVRRERACEGGRAQGRRAQAGARAQRLLRRAATSSRPARTRRDRLGWADRVHHHQQQNVGGELTSDFLDLFLATVLAKGSSDKVIFTGTHRRVLHLALPPLRPGRVLEAVQRERPRRQGGRVHLGRLRLPDPGRRQEGVVELPVGRERLQRQPVRRRHVERRAAAAARPRHEAADQPSETRARTAIAAEYLTE